MDAKARSHLVSVLVGAKVNELPAVLSALVSDLVEDHLTTHLAAELLAAILAPVADDDEENLAGSLALGHRGKPPAHVVDCLANGIVQGSHAPRFEGVLGDSPQ